MSDLPVRPIQETAMEAVQKLDIAMRMIAKLNVENSHLRGQLAVRDAELRRAWARIEKLQTRERAFVQELIREMTLTAELTERIEQ